MPGVRPLLMLSLAAAGAVFTALWGRDMARKRARPTVTDSADPSEAFATRAGTPSIVQTAIGFVANFYDTLGMNLKAVFPVMMGSCAFIMPASGIRFIGRGNYSPRAALGLALGGVPGVLLAAYVVRELRVDHLRWLVIAVAIYSALAMLNSAAKDRRAAQPETTEP